MGNIESMGVKSGARVRMIRKCTGCTGTFGDLCSNCAAIALQDSGLTWGQSLRRTFRDGRVFPAPTLSQLDGDFA